jgi:hypothetical protein
LTAEVINPMAQSSSWDDNRRHAVQSLLLETKVRWSILTLKSLRDADSDAQVCNTLHSSC